MELMLPREPHFSKPKITWLSFPCKCSACPETLYIQSANPQTSSRLWAFSPQTMLNMWSKSIRYFYFFLPCSLFFALQKCPALYPFGSSLKGNCPLHKVLNKPCLYHRNCFLSLFLTVFGDKAWNGICVLTICKTRRHTGQAPSEFTLPLLITEGTGQVTLKFELHSLASNSPIQINFILK